MPTLSHIRTASGLLRSLGPLTVGRLVPVVAAVLLASYGIASIRAGHHGAVSGERAVAAALGAPVPGPNGLLGVHALGGQGTCAVSVTATPRPFATIGLTVAAPCHAGARLEWEQGALTATEVLDGAGRLETTLPALSEAPVIAIRVRKAAPVTLQAWVGDFDAVHRTVLHWRGEGGPAAPTFAGGAGWGAPGQMEALATEAASAGALVTRIGHPGITDGHRALVYTTPVGSAAPWGVEPAVTEAGCGRADGVGTIRVGPAIGAAHPGFSMTLPDCDAIGEIGYLGDATAPSISAGG